MAMCTACVSGILCPQVPSTCPRAHDRLPKSPYACEHTEAPATTTQRGMPNSANSMVPLRLPHVSSNE
eukprot:1372745-Pyramimonas_sp.AAC.1